MVIYQDQIIISIQSLIQHVSKMYFKGYVCATGCILSKGNANNDDIQCFKGTLRVIIKYLHQNIFSHKPDIILSQFLVKFLSPKILAWSSVGIIFGT